MFFGIALEPDDFVHLALGTPPTLGGSPTGKLTWDGSKGAEKVELTSSEGTQRLSIDTRQDHWDVLDSELAGTDGKTKWSVANTGFRTVEGSGQQRVPGKTQFKSPAQNQDLLVEWSEMKVNITPPANAFTLQAPTGLPQCGAKAPAGGGGAKPPAATGTTKSK